MHRRLCVLCASLPQQAFVSTRCPEEISQTPSLCHRGMLPPFTQDFAWSFTVKLVHRKTSSNKGTGDQRGNKAVKRQESWLAYRFCCCYCFFLINFLESSLDQHSLHHLGTVVFNLQQSKGLFCRDSFLQLGVTHVVKELQQGREWGRVRELLIYLTRIADQLHPSHVQASFSAHPPGQRSFAWKAFHHFSNTCNQDYTH